MLSNQKLVDALYAYFTKHGFDGLIRDYNYEPLKQIKPLPPFLVDQNEAQRLLARNSRVSPSESLADKTFVHSSEAKFGTLWDNLMDTFYYFTKQAEENLFVFLAIRLKNPHIEVKLQPIPKEEDITLWNNVYKKFPFALHFLNPTINITCSIPNKKGEETPENTASASLEFLLIYNAIMGSDYTIISAITVDLPKELNDDGTLKNPTNPASSQLRKIIDGTFLYKARPELSSQEKKHLANGSARMLLSREAEFRALVLEFLRFSFLDGKVHTHGALQERTLRLIASLISEGKLIQDNFEILANNFNHYTSPDNSNKIEFRHICTAAASFGKHENVDIEIVVRGTLLKGVNHIDKLCYYLEKFDIQLDSKNKDALKTLAGSEKQNLRFVDTGEKTPASCLGRKCSKEFHKYLNANLEVQSNTDKSNPSADSSLENSSSGDSNSKPTSAAKVETSISPTDKPLVGIQDKKDNPETQPTVASNTSSAAKVKTSISPTDKPLVGIQDKKDNPETQTYVDELPQVNFFEKPSLLRRILGIPVSIVKFTFNVIVKCITFPFSLVARCFSKVVGLFCSKPSSTDASLNSTSQTNAVASDTSKGQSTETVGKVAPAKDKGGTSPAEQPQQTASAGPATQPSVTSGVNGKDQVALDNTGTPVQKVESSSTETTVKSSLTGVEPATLAADKSAIASAPAAR